MERIWSGGGCLADLVDQNDVSFSLSSMFILVFDKSSTASLDLYISGNH